MKNFVINRSKKASILPTGNSFRMLLVGALLLGWAIVIGTFGHVAQAAAACAPTGTTYGTDTMTVSVPSSNTYYLWVDMEAPSSSSNAIMLQVDGNSCFNVGGSSTMPTGSLNWVNYQNGATATPMSVSLSEGTHTLELIGTEAGVSVDKIELLTDGTCTPTGDGTNCAPSNVAPPTISFVSPTASATVSGSSVPISVIANSASGISQVGVSDVVFEVDGSPIQTVTSAPYQTTWNSTTAANGSHQLTAVVTDTQGQSTSASETVSVNNNNGCSSGPSAPTDLTGSSTSPTSITLNWGASTPAAGCSITEYNLTQGTTVTHPTTTSATLTGLTPNSIYTFSVSASDSSGHTSASSNTLQVTTQADTTPPSAPGNPTAQVVGSSEVQLNWSAATDSVGIAYYRVYRNGVLVYSTSSANTLSYLDTTTAPNTTYTYDVSAVDTAGNEGPEAATTPATVTTPAATNTTPPSAPGNLQAALVTANSVTLSWSASTDSNGSVAGYYIYRNGGSTPVGTVTNGTSYTDDAVIGSSTYSYTVKAFTSSGTLSSASGTLSVTTLAAATSDCDPDIANVGVVNVFSASILFSHWDLHPATCAQGDLNGDTYVNVFDAAILFSHWGDKE